MGAPVEDAVLPRMQAVLPASAEGIVIAVDADTPVQLQSGGTGQESCAEVKLAHMTTEEFREVRAAAREVECVEEHVRVALDAVSKVGNGDAAICCASTPARIMEDAPQISIEALSSSEDLACSDTGPAPVLVPDEPHGSAGTASVSIGGDEQSARGLKRARDVSSGAAATSSRSAASGPGQRRSGRGLKPEGFKVVSGFEEQGLKVAARCGKKLPKTQSWCFVPLIYSALGAVPERLCREGVSTREQIEIAQPLWSQLFSHWAEWRDQLRSAIETYGAARFDIDFLPRASSANGWTTSLVFGEPREYGRLPHPQGRLQDQILNLLHRDTQNQIFASVVAITID